MLHDNLQRVCASSKASVELTSASDSYVQHIRWSGRPEDGIKHFTEVASRCAAASGVRVQVCAPLLGSTETAINARLRAPTSTAPSLRLCASASQDVQDILTACQALSAALA